MSMLVFLAALARAALVLLPEKEPDCVANASLCFNFTAPLDETSTTIQWSNYTSYGTCACDVSNACDENCCCDPDCQGQQVNFPFCLPETNPDEDNIKYQWAQRMCSEPEDPERRGTLIDWFMRTMLCIYKDNNPVLGDFYHTSATFSGLQPDSEVSVDQEMSFKNVFEAAAQVWSLQPGATFTTQKTMLRRGADGNCAAEPTTLSYLESIDEVCTIQANDCQAILAAMTAYQITPAASCSDALQNWNVSVNVSTTPVTRDTPLTVTVVDSTPGITTFPHTVRISINWAANTNADANTISKRGYSFGEAVQTSSGTFKVYAPDPDGKCDATSTRDVLFGDNIEVPCLVSLLVNDSTGIQLPGDEIQALVNGLPQASVMAAPDQPGIVNEEVVVSTVAGYDLPNWTSNEPFIEGIVQLYTFWYKQVGAKANPQKVIDQVQVQYVPVPVGYQTAEVLSNSYVNSSKLWTRIRFFEVPNDVNMKIASDVNIDAQSWLPF